MVSEGLDIIVAGSSFGCGSSREEAPRAIKGVGVKAVIARSFAFIYSRNQPNLALLGIVISDEEFYKGLSEGTGLTIILGRNVVVREDIKREFPFQLSDMEQALVFGGGVSELFRKAGTHLFRKMLSKSSSRHTSSCGEGQNCTTSARNTSELSW